MNPILTGGIFATLLVAVWDKIKGILWYFLSFFICKCDCTDVFYKYAASYVWKKLKFKKSLSPIYDYAYLGSDKEAKIFIKEYGFNNFRLIFIKKCPILAKIDSRSVMILGLKPFINHEKIMSEILKDYNTLYNNEKIERYMVSFKRGSLNYSEQSERNSRPRRGGGVTAEPPRDISPSSNINPSCLTFFQLESLNIGIRVNYTTDEFHRFITYAYGSTKMIDNLYLTNNMKDLKNKLIRWVENKKWFQTRGISWKRGILLHGPAGTGKTSFINAMAEYLDFPVFIFDLSTMTNDDLEEEWESLRSYSPCFAVFEDFDSVFDKRDNIYLKNTTSGRKPVSFDCILNILDGAKKYDGIVTFITTNFPEKIDSALGGGGTTRPGRIDYVYEMDPIGPDGKLFIAKNIFSGMINEEKLIEKVLEEDKEVTPAQFKEKCINLALETYNKGELNEGSKNC